jgi:hypothetical protein
MVIGRTMGALIGGLGLVLSSALLGGGVTAPRLVGPASAGGAAPWAAHLTTVDAALAAGDGAAALSAGQAAYAAALGSRRWEGFADVADAYLRIGRASTAPNSAAPRARDLYLSALFRARDAGSLDGVLRIAAAFDDLGDREVVEEAMRMADRLAGARPSPSVRERFAGVKRGRPAVPIF